MDDVGNVSVLMQTVLFACESSLIPWIHVHSESQDQACMYVVYLCVSLPRFNEVSLALNGALCVRFTRSVICTPLAWLIFNRPLYFNVPSPFGYFNVHLTYLTKE